MDDRESVGAKNVLGKQETIRSLASWKGVNRESWQLGLQAIEAMIEHNSTQVHCALPETNSYAL